MLNLIHSRELLVTVVSLVLLALKALPEILVALESPVSLEPE